MKGVLPWLVSWAYRTVTRDLCFALATLVGPVQYFFPHHPQFRILFPHRSESSQAAVLDRPSHIMCLWCLFILGHY
jgi:hypothetical protein